MPPSLLAPAPIPARPRYGRPSLRKWLAKAALRISVLAVLLALAWGGWYLANKGFGRQWRSVIVEELQKRGVEASVRRLTLDPFRGLVAQDVRIFDSKNRANTVAVISEVALDINYAALLHRQPFLNALDVRNADLTVPRLTTEGKTPPAQLRNFHAHIYFPLDQIVVSQAEGFFCGIRVSATGQLIRRGDYKPSAPLAAEEWRQRKEKLQMLVTQLGLFSFKSDPPHLQIKFSGDLSELETARMDATLRGEGIQRGAHELKSVFAAAEWSEQRLSVTQCEWSDRAGTFSGRGSWSRENGMADFQARSSIDAKQFLEAFGLGLLAEATFTSPPIVEVSGSADFNQATPRLHVLGRVAAHDFAYKKIPLLDLRANFSWDGVRTMLREVHLRHESGELRGDLLDAPNDFRLNLESTINPTALGALASIALRKFLGEWDFQRSPAVRVALRGAGRNPASWNGDGTVALQRARFRGIWMNSANAELHFGDSAVSFKNFRITREEGEGVGSFTYDFGKNEVRLKDVKSTLRPADAIYWIDPKLLKQVQPYKFREPPAVTANGVVQIRGDQNTRLELTVDAPAGMDYVFLGKALPFDRVSGRLLFTEDRLQLIDLSAGIYSGVARGSADISLAKNDARYRASVALEGVDFPQITKLYFNYETARGELSGSYDFAGLGDDARTMAGAGKLKVANGNVFAIPIFGPLSELAAAIIPGAGYSIAQQAKATFTVKEGTIHTDDFKVSGKLFGMIGDGDILFLDDKLDFDIRINASGPGALLTPVYKLFEYKGEGSLSKPFWHPKVF